MVSKNIARLHWQCRRGMLELDALLQPFFAEKWSTLSSNQIEDFERLLTFSDQELYLWFIGSEKPDDQNLMQLIDLIKDHRYQMNAR